MTKLPFDSQTDKARSYMRNKVGPRINDSASFNPGNQAHDHDRTIHHTASMLNGPHNPTYWQSHSYASCWARNPRTINSITTPPSALNTCLGCTPRHRINASRTRTTRFGQITHPKQEITIITQPFRIVLRAHPTHQDRATARRLIAHRLK